MKKIAKKTIKLIKNLMSKIKISLSLSIGPVKLYVEPSRSALVFFYLY